MIEIIVLLKLVPDIRHIPEDAWDLERGTLKRNRLKLIPNPLDDRALQTALDIRDSWGGRVTALSMGPGRADEICARALAFGADEAVLVSDRSCAGSDTLATSIVLARTIEGISPLRENTLVVAGMQSPDGDTAQVPVQVAALLRASVVPYLTGITVSEASLDYRAIASAGTVSGRVPRHGLPAILTCTEQLSSLPFHTPLARLARAASRPPRLVTASDLGLEAEEVGLAGSATRVVSISVAESVRREVDFVEWPGHSDPAVTAAHLVKQLEAGFNRGGVPQEETRSWARGAVAAGDAPGNTGAGTSESGGNPLREAVWVYVGSESQAERLGILEHAREVASAMGCAAVACAVSEENDELRAMVGRAGATDLLLVHSEYGADPVGVALALEAALAEFKPRVVLLPASPEGRVTAPYLAARIGAGLTADCTSFQVKDFTLRRHGTRTVYHDVLYQKRPALGGNIEATIVSPRNVERNIPQLATVRPGPTGAAEPRGPVPVHSWSAPKPTHTDNPVVSAVADISQAKAMPGAKPGNVEIERCKVLVSVGRGAGGETGIAELAGPLVRAIRKRFQVEVELSASRVVVDAGDLERDRQVGQTGKTVKPDIYIALGISGSAQHRAGMDGSSMIFSINSDAEAPIRTISDVFVHARAHDVVPELIRALERQE